ncbi:hydroxypyruvate isomerase family protein [Bacillus massilinigeriensis]|uniref:hydroxypyruvate isomerase family protein n=1 Tax=Bacillus massilionigeriensis TaxID=1805475 RepID=UPI00096AE659|nr:hydroxypyruvate isomerase family protein [Bacillus massilionigeriensis]
MFPFAVNLSTIFTEVPFIERFQKAKEAGFSNVECQFPYSFSIPSIKEALDQNNLSLVLINLPPGEWESGERGIAIFPEKIEQFQKSVFEGIEYAKALNVHKIHCMAGILPSENQKEMARKTYIKNLKFAAEKFAEHNLTLLIEPINREDMPGYFLTDIIEAVHIIEEVAEPNLKLQYDFYHIQKIKGNLLSTFEQYFHLIGHVQIADVPGRHQPGTGEINYNRVFEFILEKHYPGFIGLEYTPLGESEESFDWVQIMGFGGNRS